ncbi:DeoR family transcriptional regulator [Actinomadura yumaensis]|uniref:DeoR family transcriptional regulator n=1 Tax=Actinomadura yumaensis TaxID=111807 RepID=UPI00360BFFE3
MSGTDRLRRITEAVREAGSVGVAELAGLTGASEMTIRRDLEVLASQGVLERYRGGARSLLLRGEEPPSHCGPARAWRSSGASPPRPPGWSPTASPWCSTAAPPAWRWRGSWSGAG